MPRNHPAGASSLRNRNRITNKSRLKIHHGNLDADLLLIPDEDEEKHRLTNLVAGVDAEDANEHHLQEVLSASQRHGVVRTTRGGADQPYLPAAYIPTPDSTGIVDNYDILYPLKRWKDPSSYVCTSKTVEESIDNALANGFTYYMDERDMEWLNKSNEEARGEGTSAQGAVLASGTRTSARSAKAKGKEPESSQPVVISEDEFELVMGLFEKMTFEKTEYLHHGLETGMTFPPFSDYQETFLNQLAPNTFTSYIVPVWTPLPSTLLRIARTIYPYWRERRVERRGHRIIPVLNGDETDTLNESYICFRRREIKAVRKTRASQVTSSDKLARLQVELSFPLEIAKSILSREKLKQLAAQQAQAIWENRLALVDLKRKFPTLGDKADEDILIDKERPVKKSEPVRAPLKIRTHDSAASARLEVAIRPKERAAMISEQVEKTMQRQKDLDHHWEDQLDNVYQPPILPYISRFFKHIPRQGRSTSSARLDSSESSSRGFSSLAVRLRVGRGGRRMLDRRNFGQSFVPLKRQRRALFDDENEVNGVDNSEVSERLQRLQERWKFDLDDGPIIGPDGPEEQDRVLVDDYDSKYMRVTMTLLSETDQQALTTDASLIVPSLDGRQQIVTPFRLGMPQPPPRATNGRMYPPNMVPPGLPGGHLLANLHAPINSVHVSLPQQMKMMMPPNGVPQMRISSNSGMRPPGLPVIPNLQQVSSASHTPPPHPLPVPVPQHSPSTGVSNSRAAISMPHVEVMKPDPLSSTTLNGVVPPIQQVDINGQNAEQQSTNCTPTRPKSQIQHPLSMQPNGYHLTPLAQPATGVALATPPQYYNSTSGLSMQQVQTLKTAFAAMHGQDMQANINRNLQTAYMLHNGLQLSPAGNINLKMPSARQMQWGANGAVAQRPTSNGIDGQGMNINMNGTIVGSPNIGITMPVRSPSANGTRVGLKTSSNGRVMGSNGQMAMSPHLQHSTPSLVNQSQSPPRLTLTTNLAMASPSLQHQQSVGSTQGGY